MTFNDLIAGAQKTLFNVPPTTTPSIPNPKGMVAPGNIDLGTQPRIPNEDGSVSGVRSASFVDDKGRNVLIPTVTPSGSRLLSMPEAVNQYYQTGKHLGMFATPDHADTYADTLHNDYAQGKIKGYAGVTGNTLESIGPRNVQGGNTVDSQIASPFNLFFTK